MTSPRELRALSVWQPWASAIVGPKPLENRRWPPWEKVIGKYIALHASLTIDDDDAFAFCRCRGWDPPPRDQLVRGAIIGVVRVDGYVTESDDPWFVGPFGWRLSDRRAIEPVPCRGRQGLWVVPPTIADQVRERWRAANGHGLR